MDLEASRSTIATRMNPQKTLQCERVHASDGASKRDNVAAPEAVQLSLYPPVATHFFVDRNEVCAKSARVSIGTVFHLGHVYYTSTYIQRAEEFGAEGDSHSRTAVCTGTTPSMTETITHGKP